MDKTTQLFIRACKSKNALERVGSVYKRFYWSKVNYAAIASILAVICDEYCPFKTIELMTELDPKNDWMHGTEYTDHYERCVSRLISKICLTEADKFKGLTAPLMFRKSA